MKGPKIISVTVILIGMMLLAFDAGVLYATSTGFSYPTANQPMTPSLFIGLMSFFFGILFLLFSYPAKKEGVNAEK